jgi:tetratricopeptide (TPR) repeat protein
MGVAYIGLGKYQEAIDACKKAIEIKPDYHEAYHNMGVAYNGLGKHQEAIDAYKEAITIL